MRYQAVFDSSLNLVEVDNWISLAFKTNEIRSLFHETPFCVTLNDALQAEQ